MQRRDGVDGGGDGGGDGGDYFGTPHNNNNTTDSNNVTVPPATPGEPPATPVTERPPERTAAIHNPALRNVQFTPLGRQQTAIRLRRLPRRVPLAEAPALAVVQDPRQDENGQPSNAQNGAASGPQQVPVNLGQDIEAVVPVQPPSDAAPHGVYRVFRRRRRTGRDDAAQQALDEDCYDSRIVDVLDVIDPEVATLSSITNIQNSLFVPSLGKWVNRRPTYDLSQLPKLPGAFPASTDELPADKEGAEGPEQGQRPTPTRVLSLSSVLSEPQYAILPNDASLEGWDKEDIKLLNDYVRHMLHSRRSKIKQRLKGFIKYAKRPLGFLITLYATLITLFGLAWVLFLIGWIYVGDRQIYVINVIDYVLVALFAIVGDGLAPFRAIDTYHMVLVTHYHRKTWKMRKKLLLPKLRDHNDLPTAHQSNSAGENTDIEAQAGQNTSEEADKFVPVLSDKEQERLEHHQNKLAKSHTFFKPHETETHRAFPLRLLIAIVLLLDLHSCLQITLGAVTFGIEYHVRPTAVTTTVLCCSIVTNIVAGILISIGDRRTRKQDVLDRLLKQELTGEVMDKMKKKKAKKAEEEREEREGVTATDKIRASLTIPWSERKSIDTSSEKNTERARSKGREAGKIDLTDMKRERIGSADTGEDTLKYPVPGAFGDEEAT